MAEIQDDEYGRIVVRRNTKSRYVKLSVAPNGSLQISAPLYTPLLFIKLFIQKSKKEIQEMLSHHLVFYEDAMIVGKSHKIKVVSTTAAETHIRYTKPTIYVALADGDLIKSKMVQDMIRPFVVKALRAEAKAYLSRRIEYLADKTNLSYHKLRFSHAKSRWGSCTSDGTISLNIALMKLEPKLIDYVVIHELAHTKELNHSSAFWSLVQQNDPHYKAHRKLLKEYSPHI